MIINIKHKGLRLFYNKDDSSKLPADFIDHIRDILSALDVAKAPKDMKLPSFGFHRLKGDRKGAYAVTVTANWRITFGFDGENAVDVDYEDYH